MSMSYLQSRLHDLECGCETEDLGNNIPEPVEIVGFDFALCFVILNLKLFHNIETDRVLICSTAQIYNGSVTITYFVHFGELLP